MSNLLKDASILLTPTAYDNGKMLSIKPTDGDGDFTFSRNSAATRVNAQGLVENVQILSSNLIQNGDFSEEGAEQVTNGSFSQEGSELVTNGGFDTDSDWTKGTGWSIADGKASNDGSVSGNDYLINSPSTVVIGKTYKVEFTLSNYTQGSIRVKAGNAASVFVASNGNYIQYMVATNTETCRIQARNNFNGSIDNVSVKEVGQDWTLGTGWSIGEDKATSDGSSTNLDQTGTFTSSTTYKVVYTIEDYVSGDTRFRFTGTSNENGTLRNSNGTYTEYIKLTNNQETLRFIGSGVLSITNISVKEVGQNWNIEDTWTIGNSVANGNGANGGSEELIQSNVTIVGRTYSISYEIKNYVSGSVRTQKPFGISRLANGVYTEILSAPTTLIKFRGANFIGSITNIVIKEVTNDTDLPRINYEGFSYQDALGSELLTNGDFSNGSTGWTLGSGWSIGDDIINFSNPTGTELYQALSTTIGKYKIKFDLNITNGTCQTSFTSPGTSTIESFTTNGTKEVIIETTSNYSRFRFVGIGNSDFTITNVSVKEYLGQEVVPDSGCGSWLLENESTNLVTQSELFSDASWVKSRSTYTSDAIKSPSGLINMGYLTEDTTATNTHYMRTFLTLTDGVDYTLSVFAKAKERNIICLGDNAAAQSNTGVWFDLTNGVVLTQRSGYVGSIKDFGNGIYRCSVIYSAAAARQYADIAISLSDGVNVYTGDGTSGVYIWGAQLEQQSYATSYIPTSGASSTRLRDLATDSGNSTLINSTEGVLYAEIKPNAIYNLQRWLSLSDGSQNNTIKIGFLNSSTNLKIAGEVRSGGVSQAFMAEDFGAVSLAYFKVAVKYKENDFALWINGVEVFTDTSGVTPIGLNQSSFNRGNNVQQFFGKTKALAVYKEALTDAELTCLTTI